MRLDDEVEVKEEELPLSRGLRGWMGPERGWWRRFLFLLGPRGLVGLVVVEVAGGLGRDVSSSCEAVGSEVGGG